MSCDCSRREKLAKQSHCACVRGSVREGVYSPFARDWVTECTRVCVCVRVRVRFSTLPCARDESDQRTRLQRKQRVAVAPRSVILPHVPRILRSVVPLSVRRCADEGCSRQPLSVKCSASTHLPRAEREPSELSPGRMLLHIQRTRGERGRETERERERERGRRRERGGKRERFYLPPPSNTD